MYKEIRDFGPEVTLVANSAIQFLDFGFTLGSQKGPSCAFAETPSREDPEKLRLRKLVADPESDTMTDEQSGEPVTSDAIYSVSLADALRAFDDTWLPLPFFKTGRNTADIGAEKFEKGPKIWARLRVLKLPAPDPQGFDYRATIAFDTRFEERSQNRPYTMITPEDIEKGSNLELAKRFDEYAWFLDEHWVIGWLRDILAEAREDGRMSHVEREDGEPAALVHWSFYVALLDGLTRKVSVPRVHFLDTISGDAPTKPFDVDLILDIGNNRTCGVLVEHSGDGTLGLESASRLEIRDMEHVEMVYSRPFQSRVEFRELGFGSGKWPSNAGGKPSLFRWPSYLRLGDEAQRLNGNSVGTEGISGLSAPKRYLWDDRARDQLWSFNVTGKPGARSTIGGQLMRHVTESGELAIREEGMNFAYQARFSRASLFSMQVMEILLHAMRQINEPSYRWTRQMRDVPRRLRRIIMTVPSATPVVEQEQFQKRAQDGLDLLWETMEWSKPERKQFDKPILRIAYDEASCTQLVFLYSEIIKRYRRSAEEYIALKAPASSKENPSLRIASIDIGGGTTDLMVSTYASDRSQPHQLKLTQNFREGFRLAGDDIVQQVISRHVLTAIAADLRAKGMARPLDFLTGLLNDSKTDAQSRQRRVLLVNQIFGPIALALLGIYEKVGSIDTADGTTFSEAFAPSVAPPEALVAFFDHEAKAAGAEDFSLRQVHFPMVSPLMDETIDITIGRNLRNLAEVVARLDCDYLLMTGRPSRLPGVRSAIVQTMAVAPHRIVFMHEYQIGDWYPFASAGNVIGDPKTTVVVGALICALAEDGMLDNFSIAPRSFALPSTASVVGLMDAGGALMDSSILFRRDADGGFPEQSEAFSYSSPVLIGFRQIDSPTWPATPLYRLHIPPDQMDASVRQTLPWKVHLARPEQSEAARRRGDVESERFRIGSTERSDGNDMPSGRKRLVLQLQTLYDADGFWTDTGKLDVPREL